MKKLLATLAVAFLMSAYAWGQINQGGGAGSVQNPSAGGGSAPCASANAIQIKNPSDNTLNCDPNITIDSTTHTLKNPNGNTLVNALSSVPRAVYDPMDTKYCATGGICGLRAAIAAAGSSPTAPAQVINAALDDGECQIQMNATPFHAVNIPLPNGVTIPISGIRYWGTTSLGGDSGTLGPILQHNDSSQIMVAAHASGDGLTCSNGTTYHPASGGVGQVYLHNFQIAGMFNPATHTDIGVELNAVSSVAANISGTGNAFGGPAVISNGTSTFLFNMGFPGSQLQGCKTYNTGVLAVSGFTLGSGRCAAVMDVSLDGGAENVYASDGQAILSGHPAGPCYPNCAAFEAGGSGTYDDNIFAQVSSVGVALVGSSIKAGIIRVDDVSREAVQISGSATVDKIKIDSACVDTALQSNYNAGVATGCFALVQTGSSGSTAYAISAVNNSGIFSPAYVQAWIQDTATGSSGTSSTWGLLRYQGLPNNTTANDWAFGGTFDGSQTAGRVIFPSMSPMSATGTTINASGITNVVLNGQSVTKIVAGINGQHLTVYGSGTMKQGTIGVPNSIYNQNGLDNSPTVTQALEYVNVGSLASNAWVMVAGPANQTPTHVNFAGNATPSNPSLLHVIGDTQASLAPAFSLTGGSGAIQLHGPNAASGQACFVEEAVFSDGHHVVSDQVCTQVDLSTQTPGGVFAAVVPQSTINLWMTSNTEPNGIATGKFPAAPSGVWDGPTTIAAGGNGATPVVPLDNNTGSAILAFGVYGPASAPSGTCTPDQGGAFIISQDGHGTLCPVGGGTWTSKF